jgi:5'-methylthioadenosine phosphorylase
MNIAVFTPLAVEGEVVDTTFGPAGPLRIESLGDWSVIFIQRGGDARARVVAAKERGALHGIGLGEVIALDPDLRAGAWLAPEDAIDQTRGTPTTFFVGRGLGYLSQSPPFCPETRAALVNVIGDQNGIVIAAPDRAITPAEVKAWGILGGKIAMPGLGPEWYLCRELEIGYAPLCYVSWTPKESSSLTDDLVRSIIVKIVAALPGEHSWTGTNSAARRELGEDWRQWIISN